MELGSAHGQRKIPGIFEPGHYRRKEPTFDHLTKKEVKKRIGIGLTETKIGFQPGTEGEAGPQFGQITLVQKGIGGAACKNSKTIAEGGKGSDILMNLTSGREAPSRTERLTTNHEWLEKKSDLGTAHPLGIAGEERNEYPTLKNIKTSLWMSERRNNMASEKRRPFSLK